MKKLLTILCLLVFGSSGLLAQWSIESTELTFVDANRGDREVPIELYYPTDWVDPVGQDEFPEFYGPAPTLIIGHGFVMNVNAYMHMVNELVPQGYAIALVETEGSFSPSHEDFGLDFVFVAESLSAISNDPTSDYFSLFSDRFAVAGHSMGGGSSFIAAANNNDIFKTLIGFAPAETSPSAISASESITIPSLVFAGGDDCITPPSSNQIPMYEGLSSTLKYYVEIDEGTHCFFADPSVTCEAGESLTCPPATIEREEQHQILFSLLTPWLDTFLKGDCERWEDFTAALPEQAISFEQEGEFDYDLISGSIIEGVDALTAPVADSYVWLNDLFYLDGENAQILNDAPIGFVTNIATNEDGCVAVNSLDVYAQSTNDITAIDAPFSVFNMNNNTVKIEGSEPFQYQLYNLQGKLMLQSSAANSLHYIPLDDVSDQPMILRLDSNTWSDAILLVK